jgi:diguanylate cyclase (GGDEF)-like protein
MLSRLSLRNLLTVPYVLLVLLLALVIGALSFAAGRNAIDNLSGLLLDETVTRISVASTQHISGSQAVLEAAFPMGMPAPTTFDDQALTAMRLRFWIATSIHRDPNNYAYYGDQAGRFYGVFRSGDVEAEVRVRQTGEGMRSIYRFSGIDGALQTPSVETRVYDPRERPYFNIAQKTNRHLWTPIYIDFRNNELVTTRVRRVNNAQGEFAGVVATDLALQRVSTFLKRLDLSANAVAMIVEPDGQLVGVSRGATTQKDAQGESVRINAAQSSDALVAATFAAVSTRINAVNNTEVQTTSFDDATAGTVQVGYAKLQDDAGLNWWIMVAVPRSDFLGQVEKNFQRTLWLGLTACLAVVLLGLMVLSTVSRELRTLAQAAKGVGDGTLLEPLQTKRSDELGDLARSFSDMQVRLLTDPLTGLQNREAVLRTMEDRIVQRRRTNDARPFAVLFADINQFKSINDRFGHDVGDEVLREVASRMRRGVRTQDLVARYAGDEFVILLDAVEHARDAHVVRANLEASLREPLHSLHALAPGESFTGATFGVAVFPADGQDVETLVKRADEDMYRRKGSR